MLFSRSTFTLALISTAFAAGCAEEATGDGSLGSTSQAYTPSSFVSVRDDGVKIADLVAPAKYKYTDIAVSDSEVYLLRTKIPEAGETLESARSVNIIEKRSLYKDNQGIWHIGGIDQLNRHGAYTAIDYVRAPNNTWGLVALKDNALGLKQIVRNAETNSVVMGTFTDVVGAATNDLVGVDSSEYVNGSKQARIKLYLRRDFGDSVHVEFSAGAHTQPASGQTASISWAAGTRGEVNYNRTLTEKGGSLFVYRTYMAGAFIKVNPTTWTNQLEEIKNPGETYKYDSHGFTFENSTVPLSPVGVDFQESEQRFVVLSNQKEHQMVVVLSASRVNL